MRAHQSLALERFLDGGESAKKPASLLQGLGAKLVRASDLPAHRSGLAKGASDHFLESLLVELPAQTLIEVVGRRCSGRFSIGLAAMACSTASGESTALVDLGDHFDPDAAEKAGVVLERVLWVRPRRVQEALAAVEMLLGAGFRLVVADLGLAPRGGRFVPDAAWMRLQRAARDRAATLFLLVPYRLSGIAADAVISASARPLWRGGAKAPYLLAGVASHVTLEKLGHETPGRSVSMRLSVSEAIATGVHEGHAASLRDSRNPGKQVEARIEAQNPRDLLPLHDREVKSVAGRQLRAPQHDPFGVLDVREFHGENVVGNAQ